jgi:repressor LexA
MNLTDRQLQVLEYIESFISQNGMSPTFREIASHFGFKSPRAVTDHVAALRRKGMLDIIDERKQRNLVTLRPVAESELSAPMPGIPILGSIAAGNPIEAIEQTENYVTMDFLGLANATNNLFALVVKGDSMIQRGIHSGDIVIIRKQKVVTTKEVAAVRIGNEVTLKYVRPETNCVKLVPDNDALEPITVHPNDDIEVMGKVVKLIRRDV